MDLYTLVWLKSDRIGFLIVGLKHLDSSIDTRVALLLHVYVPSDRVGFCVLCRFKIFFPGLWPGSRRAGAFLKITTSKSAIVHLVCVIVMYTIYEMYKEVASSRSSFAIFLEFRGRVFCCWWQSNAANTVVWTMATVQTTQTKRKHVQTKWYSISMIRCYIFKVSPMQNMLPYSVALFTLKRLYWERFAMKPIGGLWLAYWWIKELFYYDLLYYNDAYKQQYVQYLPAETFNLKSCQNNISLLALIMFD